MSARRHGAAEVGGVQLAHRDGAAELLLHGAVEERGGQLGRRVRDSIPATELLLVHEIADCHPCQEMMSYEKHQLSICLYYLLYIRYTNNIILTQVMFGKFFQSLNDGESFIVEDADK